MIIDEDDCVGCLACQPYCPVGAIQDPAQDDGGFTRIDQEQCVECGVCLRADVCPTDAIRMPELAWPRSVRASFSNPTAPHRGTDEMGRGTEEMKTNEVTGLFRRGVAGVAIEMGRPGLGTSMRDVETMARAVAEMGVEFAPVNPVTRLIADPKTGELDPEILGERVLSAIIEFHLPANRLTAVLAAIRTASKRIDTVFSLDLISRVEPDGTIPVLAAAQEAGFSVRPNCKTNVGLGRPLKQEG
ncbi:MAG: 4Fe-4S binding protein [Deferrisomatales bacterium]